MFRDQEARLMLDYILMSPMYPTMTSGKIDKYLVDRGDKVTRGTAVAEIISEGFFTLLSEVEGIVMEFYVGEGEYVEVDTPLLEVEIDEPEA
jgi:pyruvate/2-oxoglutarate dehydrogenase complex dihydrolipoamide acyltransferase (E2) component